MSAHIQPFNLSGLPSELQGLVFDNVFAGRLYGTFKSHKALKGKLMEVDDDCYHLLMALDNSAKLLEEVLTSFGKNASYALHDGRSDDDDDDDDDDRSCSDSAGNRWRVYDTSLVGYDQRRFLALLQNVNIQINDIKLFERRGNWMVGISDVFTNHGLPFRYNIRNITITIKLSRSDPKMRSNTRMLCLNHWLTVFPHLIHATVTVELLGPAHGCSAGGLAASTPPWGSDIIRVQGVINREDATLEREVSEKVRWFWKENEETTTRIYPGSS